MPDPKTDHSAEIARINQLTGTSKGIWYALLSYLAFVGVTWMGVQDVDFFLPERQTDLPLIGVSVPTLLFFAIAPTLGALIYAYFQIQLLKLWEVLARADACIDGRPLSDHIQPWLINDLCLAYRTDGALRERPLARSARWINFAFIFWGPPLVLTAMWWASAPRRYEWLTLLACGLPLIFTFFVGIVSWQRMRDLVADPDAEVFLRKCWRVVLASMTVAITAIGWFRLQGDAWLLAELYPRFFASADLRGINFAQTPDDWQDRENFRLEYRQIWCNKVGMPAHVCGPAPELTPDSKKEQPLSLRLARAKWCADLAGDTEEQVDCANLFRDQDTLFEAAWLHQRELDIAALPSFDFEGADLRRADLREARLQGANLRWARLQGADLREAELQGADLREAELQGADLGATRLQGADLREARLHRANLRATRLQGADLREARLQRANLREAELQGADLREAELQGVDLREAELQGTDLKEARLQGTNLLEARLQGAYLGEARLQGAYLGRAQFDEATDLTAADLRGAAVRSVNFTNVPQIAIHLDDIFGDGSVTLPGGAGPDSSDWPKHWPKEKLGWDDFHNQWRAWQRKIGFDPDNIPDD